MIFRLLYFSFPVKVRSICLEKLFTGSDKTWENCDAISLNLCWVKFNFLTASTCCLNSNDSGCEVDDAGFGVGVGTDNTIGTINRITDNIMISDLKQTSFELFNYYF